MIGNGLFWEICQVARKAGTDRNGQPTYSAPALVRAGITRRAKLLKGPDGADILSSAQVSLPAGLNIQVQDRITLPEGRTLPVQAVTLSKGPYNIETHTVAFL